MACGRMVMSKVLGEFLRWMPSSGKFYSSEVSFAIVFIKQQKLLSPGMW